MVTPNCTTSDERSSCQVRRQDSSAITHTLVSLSCLIQAALRIPTRRRAVCAYIPFSCLLLSSEGSASDVSDAALPALAAYLL